MTKPIVAEYTKHFDGKVTCQNFIPSGDGGIKKIRGWRSFVGLVWQLLVVNRKCKKASFRTKITFELPIRWIP